MALEEARRREDGPLTRRTRPSGLLGLAGSAGYLRDWRRGPDYRT